MARSNLGENIAKYRREAGINQDELGRAAGVSAQAVSRWECGGAPDVELLPAIADRLHVSIDALFGRDGSDAADLHRLLTNAIQQTPEARRMEAMCDYIWTMQKADALAAGMSLLGDILSQVQRTDRSAAPNSIANPWQAVVDHDRGISLFGTAKDLPFALVLPEPEAGFASMLKKPEEYLRLFQLLSKPRYLDMLLEVYAHKPGEQFTDRLAANRLGLPLEEARAILDDLYTHCMVQRMEVADETGPIGVYGPDLCAPLPVFLFFCRQMMRSVNELTLQVDLRTKPVLSSPPGTASLDPEWATRDRMPQEATAALRLHHLEDHLEDH